VDRSGQKNSTVVAHFFCALFFLALLRFLSAKKVKIFYLWYFDFGTGFGTVFKLFRRVFVDLLKSTKNEGF